MAGDQRPRGNRPAAPPPPQAALGLLNYLTATSLDEDYAHVSRRRAAEAAASGTTDGGPTPRGRPGRRAVVVLALFGVLIATAAAQTAQRADESASSRASLISQAHDGRAELADRRARLRALQREVSTLRTRDLATTSQGRAAERRLSQLGVVSGGAVTHGPGIQVVVDDAPGATSFKQKVQAPDLQKLVNGLWQVGAEAVAVNGQRLSNLSSIRDAGSAITVNYVSLRAPYTVSAIGDPKTMGARLLDTAGGEVLVTLRSTFGLQFDVTTKDDMVLPAAKRMSLRNADLIPGSKDGRG